MNRDTSQTATHSVRRRSRRIRRPILCGLTALGLPFLASGPPAQDLLVYRYGTNEIKRSDATTGAGAFVGNFVAAGVLSTSLPDPSSFCAYSDAGEDSPPARIRRNPTWS